jgi:hypothetical protein
MSGGQSAGVTEGRAMNEKRESAMEADCSSSTVAYDYSTSRDLATES